VQVWAKFSANEKLATYGSGLVLLAFLLGVGLYSAGSFGAGGLLGLLAAIALPVLYYLRYTNSTINWPAPIPVIALAIGALMGIAALVNLLFVVQWLGWAGFTFTWIIAPILYAIGGALMFWGTYKEWSAARAAA
jgi:hypothetical protein